MPLSGLSEGTPMHTGRPSSGQDCPLSTPYLPEWGRCMLPVSCWLPCMFPSSCTDWFRDDHFGDPLGYVVSCPDMSVGARGIMYPHCVMRMGLRVCTYLGPSPSRMLIACRLFSRVIGPKLVPVMGAPLVPSCTPVSGRHEFPDPFAQRPFFPGENGLCPYYPYFCP